MNRTDSNGSLLSVGFFACCREEKIKEDSILCAKTHMHKGVFISLGGKKTHKTHLVTSTRVFLDNITTPEL